MHLPQERPLGKASGLGGIFDFHELNEIGLQSHQSHARGDTSGLFVGLTINRFVQHGAGVHFPRVHFTSAVFVTICRDVGSSRDREAWVDVTVAVGVVQLADATVGEADIQVTAVPSSPVASILENERYTR